TNSCSHNILTVILCYKITGGVNLTLTGQWRLAQMAHEEPPWKNTKPGEIITHNALKDYFDTMIVDNEKI
ncbi:MAG: hypothetical protein H7844_09965, partial [Nitrospirae bacterium YQR-1]